MPSRTERRFIEAILAKKAEIDAYFYGKLYVNKEGLFPSGTKVIQLRNEEEYRTFERITYAAVARQSAKRDSATVTFRTEDNINQVVSAREFIPIALDILDVGQALWDVRTAHRDVVDSITDETELAAYDYTTGWPEINEPLWVMEERSSEIYKGMVRRRADKLAANGDIIGKIALLKTIGE